MANFKEDLRKIKAFAFDYDGVFTNAEVLIHPTGELLRTSSMRDGFAIAHAVKKGYPIAIISGGKSFTVRMRLEGIGVNDVYLASKNKLDDLNDFIDKYNLNYQDILYMGDDIPDYPVMKKVGLATCPEDAVTEIKQCARYISHLKGGEGCVRDVIEQVLRLNDDWFNEEEWL